LSWDGPPSATSYDVYLGTDPDFAGETPVSDDQSNTWYAPDSDLQFATTYHWQIVVNKDGSPYEGPVWSFTTQGLASNPDPADGATLVDNNDTTLTWTGEDAVVSYDIYFGKSESAVASAGHPVGDINGAGPVNLPDLKVFCEQWLSPGSATPSANLDGAGDVDVYDFAILANDWLGPFQENQTSTTFDIGTLDTNETHYWRIDEVFPGGTPTGAVWSFTTWAGAGDKDLGEKTGLMWEFLEWEVANPSWSGNAFDVVATVTFTHTNTGSTRTTEMFYDGSNTWKFRFTGTKVGEWAFTTTSLDPELNGYYGTVTIEPNPDPDIKGFLTYVGNKYAIQTGNSGELEGYLLNIYMNQQDFAMQYHQDIPGPIEDISRVDDYFDDAVDAGFGVVFYFLTHQVFQLGAIQGHEHSNVDPDLETFGRLDYIIQYSHSRGERVHFWCWGDNARDQTPINLPGGINGYVDRRLQRYIAARLGPLPGWSMGYGYDLIEWAGTSQLNSWAEYMHDHFGWQHLLSSRGRIINGADNIISYSGFGGSDLTTTRYGPQDYNEIAEDLADVTRQTQPHLYEERHTYLRDNFNLDMDGSRRLIWWEAMAGGMGGFYGYYSNWFNQWGPFHGKYPNPEQFQTHRTFWRGRFLLDMERANNLSDGYCLKTPTNDNYVFYKENTNSVQMDLSGMTSGNSAVAVDTKLSYAEIDLGTLSATNQTWPAPYVSDWAIAVGRFER